MEVTVASMSRRRGGYLGTRRGLAVSATLVVLAAGGIAAYAQFTGSGSPGAPLGGAAAAAALRIADTTVGPLTPQINPSDTTPVSVTVDNTAASSAFVGQISGAVETRGGCLGTWFTVASVPPPGVVTPGTHTYSSSVILNDDDRDQTACTSQTQTIRWTIAPSSASSTGGSPPVEGQP
jgi:hypothetical protein